MKEEIQYHYSLITENLIYREDFIEFTSNHNYYYLMLEKGNLDDGTKYLFKFNALMPENSIRQIYFNISYFNLEEEQNFY